MWTRFMDMYSGGNTKEKGYGYIYIEAPEKEAMMVFYNRFGHNPNRVSCTCCGEDYSISESETLAEVTGHERDCKTLKTKKFKSGKKKGWYKPKSKALRYYYEKNESPPKGYEFDTSWGNRECQTLREYCKSSGVLVVYASDIKPQEHLGELSEEGYVWV